MKFSFPSNEIPSDSPRWPNQRADLARNMSPHMYVSPDFSRALIRYKDTLRPEEALRLQLSGALDALSHDLPPWQKREDVQRFAVTTAHQLIIDILPPDPDIITDHEQQRTPTLVDVELLAQAADGTGDRAIFEALGYILAVEPPALSDVLVQAYEKAVASGNLINDEILAIIRKIDREDDRWLFKEANHEKAAANVDMGTAAMLAANN